MTQRIPSKDTWSRMRSGVHFRVPRSRFAQRVVPKLTAAMKITCTVDFGCIKITVTPARYVGVVSLRSETRAARVGQRGMDYATYAIEADDFWFGDRRPLSSDLLKGIWSPSGLEILDAGTSTTTKLRLLRDLGLPEGVDQNSEAIRFWARQKAWRRTTGVLIDRRRYLLRDCALPLSNRSASKRSHRRRVVDHGRT